MTGVLAIIQARTGSSRLPGKVLYPLAGSPVLEHVIERVNSVSRVDETVVATSVKPQDGVIETVTETCSIDLFRGSEENVLERFREVINKRDPSVVVRVTADCPLVSPVFLEHAVKVIQTTDTDYATVALDRTFPRGTTAEAFSAASFETVYEQSSEPRHREHVTPYYREHPEIFELHNIDSTDVFDAPRLHDRTDLRLTLDEASDYRLLKQVFEGVDNGDGIDLEAAIEYVDEHDLRKVNETIEQKEV